MLAVFVSWAAGCGPSNSGGGGENENQNENQNTQGCVGDADEDSICDEYEGREEELDTDGDGTPDFEDLDSDDDGISDKVEWGGEEPGDFPVDSDSDGTPDFQDTDSDGNGIPDAEEGTRDTDGNGILDYADTDDDGDGLLDVVEIGPDPDFPVDSDDDGDPDYQDIDSDGDTIGDAYESSGDTDEDGIPDYLDLDSDNDGLWDDVEAGDDDLDTPPVDTDDDGYADFRDADSDNDGLADGEEDLNGDGVVDPGETDPTNSDTDGDGVSDLVEVGAGTDPQDGGDNPQANGDFVFVMPYEEQPEPTEDTLDFATDLVKADIYFLVDISGSMSSITAEIKTNMEDTIVTAMTQIPDLQVGIGSFLYAECQNYKTYHHRLDVQPDANVAQTEFPEYSSSYESGCCCDEAPRSAIYCASTGHGTAEAAAAGVTVPNGIANEENCQGQPGPCPAGYLGYPCFRPGALPILIVVTDEGLDQYTATTQQDAITAMDAIGAKIIGVYGVGSWGYDGRDGLEAFATAQGSVDATGDPLVYNGSDGNASQSVVDAITALSQVPMDISSIAQDNDDGTDAHGQTDDIDAVAEFVDHLEATDQGVNCTSGWTMVDGSDSDNFPDTFLQVEPGNRVCWDIYVKENTTVEPTEHPQLFTATIYVYGDEVTEVDFRTVYFLVPPVIEGPGIPR
jgi:hypothetical protein